MITSFQALNWHTSLSQQNSAQCGVVALPCFPDTDLPHFQIPFDNLAIGSVQLVNPKGSAVLTWVVETCEIKEETKSFISFIGDPVILNGQINTGISYYEISLNGTKYYSDLFNVKSIDCFLYKLEWTHCTYNGLSCYDGIYSNVIYLEDPQLASPTYEKNVEGKENGNGEFIASYSRIDKYYNIQALTRCNVNEALQGMVFHDTITLTDLKRNTSELLSDVSISDPTDECYFLTTITYKAAAIESNSCCDDENDFEDNCITEPTDSSCNNYDIGINVSGDILNLDITGTPPNGNGPLITWSKDGSALSGTNSIDTQGLPGNYCVRVVYPDCPAKVVCHEVLDPCSQFNVQVECAGLVIDGIITGETVTPTITITDSNATVVGSSFPTTVPSDGTYIIKVVSGSCEYISTKTLNTGSECNIQFNISKNSSDELSVSGLTGCGDDTPFYQWYKEIDGLETPFGNSNTITPDETANYIMEVSCGSCILRKNRTCIIGADCIPIEIKNWDEMPLNNQPIIINVTCGECDDECNGQLEVKCVKNPDGTIDLCATFSQPGYTIEVCDQNNNVIGTGEKVPIPNEDATYIVKATNPDCPTITNTFTFNKANAGLTLRDENNPVKI